ncbi:hypothetical protein D9M73_176130 [compost metagenome]
MDGIREQAHRQQDQGVQQDMQFGVALTVGHRQHRDIGLGVFLLAVDGQRPEVRRGPGENDQHKQQGFGADMAAYRHPAEQRRSGPGQATDDDVLWRGALEKAGVEHRITE